MIDDTSTRLPWSLLVFMLQKGQVQSDFYTSVVTAALKVVSLFQCIKIAQPAFNCPKSTMETSEQSVKYFKS